MKQQKTLQVHELLSRLSWGRSASDLPQIIYIIHHCIYMYIYIYIHIYVYIALSLSSSIPLYLSRMRWASEHFIFLQMEGWGVVGEGCTDPWTSNAKALAFYLLQGIEGGKGEGGERRSTVIDVHTHAVCFQTHASKYPQRGHCPSSRGISSEDSSSKWEALRINQIWPGQAPKLAAASDRSASRPSFVSCHSLKMQSLSWHHAARANFQRMGIALGASVHNFVIGGVQIESELDVHTCTYNHDSRGGLRCCGWGVHRHLDLKCKSSGPLPLARDGEGGREGIYIYIYIRNS